MTDRLARFDGGVTSSELYPSPSGERTPAASAKRPTWAEARRELDRTGGSRLRRGPEQQAFVRRMRREPTPAEAALWSRLEHKQLGHRFSRQRTLLQYVVDFFCPATGVVVEVDGGYHNSTPQLTDYEQRRDQSLRSLGLTVMRFTNERVLADTDAVVHEIAAMNEYLGVHRPLVRRFLLANGRRMQRTTPLASAAWEELL